MIGTRHIDVFEYFVRRCGGRWLASLGSRLHIRTFQLRRPIRRPWLGSYGQCRGLVTSERANSSTERTHEIIVSRSPVQVWARYQNRSMTLSDGRASTEVFFMSRRVANFRIELVNRGCAFRTTGFRLKPLSRHAPDVRRPHAELRTKEIAEMG